MEIPMEIYISGAGSFDPSRIRGLNVAKGSLFRGDLGYRLQDGANNWEYMYGHMPPRLRE